MRSLGGAVVVGMKLFWVGGEGGPDVFCLVETIIAKLRSDEHEQ